jgi:hypothetical protein
MLLNIFSRIRCYYVIPFLISIILISTYISFEPNYPYFDIIKQVKNYFIHFENFLFSQSNKYFFNRQLSTFNPSSIQRAILVFYPSNQEEYYLPEIRWLYRSWIEMITFESNLWRTDLIIFTEKYTSSLTQLGCIQNQIRLNHQEQPKCRVFNYLHLSARFINPLTKQQTLLTNDSKIDLFRINISRSVLLYEHLRTYLYIDSVNVIAEGYPVYSYYDFILKTDLDVFITKQFSNYVPNTTKTLFVGRGGYSTEFNKRRLGRVARDMGWKYQNLINIGSTWYEKAKRKSYVVSPGR